MAKFFTILFFALIVQLKAQTTAPKFINYQGIARDASGTPITSAFDIQFTIKNSTATVHNEFQNGIQPNSLGLFSTVIGKAPNTLTVSAWDNGPFTLDVSINTGSSFTLVGSQQLVSVPFSLFAGNVPTSYTNNILTIGANSYSIGSGSSITPTIVGTGLASVTPTTGPLYSVNVPTATLGYSTLGSVLSLTQGSSVSTVTLTGSGSSTITMTGQGNAVVTPTLGSAFTVNVPIQSFSVSTNTVSSNLGGSFTLPSIIQTTINGAGIANVNPTVGNAFTVSVPGTNINFAGNTLNLSQGTISTSATYNPPPLSGDAIGPLSSNTVTALRNIPISNTVPSSNQVLTFNGSAWTPSTSTSPSSWNLLGNAGTSTVTNFIGTTDATDLLFKTSNQQRMTISATGNVAIGNITSPTTKLHLHGVDNSTNPIAFSASPQTSIRIHNDDPTNFNFSSIIFSSVLSNAALFEGAKIVGQFADHTAATQKGDLVFMTRDASNLNERMRLNSFGNLGINVTNPAFKLAILENIAPTAALFASNTSATSSLAAHGVQGQTANSNSLAAGVYGNNSGSGPSIFAEKIGGQTGIAFRSEIQNSTNTADAIFAKTLGQGAAVHAVTNATLNSSALALLLENGHVSTTGTLPTTVTVASLNGGNLSLLGTSTDVAGRITITFGTGPFTAGAYAQIVYAKPYAVAPVIILTAANGAASAEQVFVTSNLTNFIINYNSLPGSGPHVFNYLIIETK